MACKGQDNCVLPLWSLHFLLNLLSEFFLPARGKKGQREKRGRLWAEKRRGEWPSGLSRGLCFTNCLKFWRFEEFFFSWWHCFVLLGFRKMGFWRKTRSKNDPYMNPSFELFSHFPLCNLKLQVNFSSSSDSSFSLFFHGDPLWICVSIDNSVFNIFSIWDFLSDLSLLKWFFFSFQKYRISPLNLRGDDKTSILALNCWSLLTVLDPLDSFGLNCSQFLLECLSFNSGFCYLDPFYQGFVVVLVYFFLKIIIHLIEQWRLWCPEYDINSRFCFFVFFMYKFWF